MAEVVLRDLWLHLASDVEQHLTIREFGGYDAPRAVRGEVRTYSQGRRRVVRRPGRHRPGVSASFPATRDTIRQLEDWVGETLMVRDPGGRLFWGAYFEVGQSETDGGEWLDVSLSIEETTGSVEEP